MHRILKPGGLLLVTFHSKHVWQRSDKSAAIEQGEFVFFVSTKLKGILPDWYQTALQAPARLLHMLSESFSDVSYEERAFGDQDVAVAWKQGMLRRS